MTVNEPWLPRVSWGAIFGGVALAVALQCLLALLGIGVGLQSIDPARERGVGAGGLGTGAVVWSVVTVLLAMAAGGWMAGRLAGVPRRMAGALHGLIVWSLTTMALLYLASTLVGAVVGGALSVVGTVARTAGQGISTAAPDLSSGDVRGRVDWSAVRQEAMQVLRQTRDPRLQPGALAAEGQQALQGAGQDLTEAEFGAALDRLFNRAADVASEVDKRDVANVLAARTGMGQAEAMGHVEQWERKYQDLRAAAGAQASNLGRRTAQVTEDVTDAVGSSAIWTFAGLLAAAVAATGAGAAGAPKLIEVQQAEIAVPGQEPRV
jgi:hypothetical protein